MILFHFRDFKRLARELRHLPLVVERSFETGRYKNQESHLSVLSASVTGEDCMILGSIAPPDEQMLAFTLLAHTLKKEGARKVIALLPYLAYARQDKEEPHESLGMAWAGSLLKASGVDEVITIDVHSERDREIVPFPLVSISPAEVFRNIIKKYDLGDATIVAPDKGAIPRCEAVRSMAAIAQEVACFEKRRTPAGVEVEGPSGRVGERAIIIDDILDTGKTAVLASRILEKKGVKEIYIMATHGVFSDRYWRKLLAMRVKAIFCTDTVPLRKSLGERVKRVSIAPLLKKDLEERYALK